MITVRKLVVGIGALSALASAAHAQASADATAQGSATIIQPIQVSAPTGLAFGTIVKPSGATPGTVTVDAAGARNVTGGGALALASSTATAASFQVVGEGGSAYSLTVPPTFDMKTAGGDTLTVTTVNNAGLTPGALTVPGSLGAPGTATFGVGGTFNLNTATVSGAYSGNIVVTAAYN
jgi:hypothetical protein